MSTMRMKFPAASLRLLQAACLSLIFGLAWSSPAQAHTTGRAFVAFVNVPTLSAGPLHLADTGELPLDGGWEGAGFLSAEVAGVLSANVLNAATMAARDNTTGQANSSSSLAEVVVLPGHAAQLTASFVRAQAAATEFVSEGSTEIHDLTFGGMAIPVTGLPNQRVEIPGTPSLFGLGPVPPLATLVINEQTVTSDGTSQAITVNALHLILATGEEVILASAWSMVKQPGNVILARGGSNGNCASSITQVTKANWLGGSTERPPIILVSAPSPPQPKCIDFVTGGGFFLPPNSTRPGRVNFGFNAGPRSAQNPEIKGHFNLVDHFDGTHIKGVNVTHYVVIGADSDHCRLFRGDVQTTNGLPGTRYKVAVCDYGEPGRDDRIQVQVCVANTECDSDVPSSDCQAGNTYCADNKRTTSACDSGEPLCGELDGGNIQLHKSKCPKPAAFEERGEKLLKEI